MGDPGVVHIGIKVMRLCFALQRNDYANLLAVQSLPYDVVGTKVAAVEPLVELRFVIRTNE